MSIDQLRPRVRRLSERAAQLASNFLLANEPSVQDFLDEMPFLIAVYADEAALLTADWYERQDDDSRFDAFPDADIPETKLANVAKWVFDGPQTPESRARQAAHRLVFDAARRTVFVNAAAEGVAIARHELAKCCNECIASATLSARDRNSSSEDVEQFFHPGCEGMFIPVRKELFAPPEYVKEWRVRVSQARRLGNTTPERIANWLTAH